MVLCVFLTLLSQKYTPESSFSLEPSLTIAPNAPVSVMMSTTSIAIHYTIASCPGQLYYRHGKFL